MRNIIDWNDPADALFTARLGRRIDDIMSSILAQRSKLDEEEKNREKFLALSYDDRCESVLKAAITECESEEFRLQQVGAESSYSDNLRQRQSGETLDGVVVRLIDLRNKSQEDRKWEISRKMSPEYFNLNLNWATMNGIKIIKEHYIACCLELLNAVEIEHALFEFHRSPKSNLFVFAGTRQVPILPYESTEPVFYPIFGDTTFGFGVKRGACVKYAPSNLKSNPPLVGYGEQRFRVVECRTRDVRLIRTYQIVHHIESMEGLIPRPQSCFRSALAF
jgi:hypothetical protein